MKTDGLLARNWLKGSDGDAIHAVLFGAGHNLSLSPGTIIVIPAITSKVERGGSGGDCDE